MSPARWQEEAKSLKAHIRTKQPIQALTGSEASRRLLKYPRMSRVSYLGQISVEGRRSIPYRLLKNWPFDRC